MEFHEVLVVIILIALICGVLYSYRNYKPRVLKNHKKTPINEHIAFINRRYNGRVKR